jgi:twitching motility two-component system response regulator PilG
MTIQGNLGTIGQGPTNLLRGIYRDKMTGRLSIFYENEQKRNVQDVIFIDQGTIVGLKSLDKYGVKELMIYAGKLTKAQVAEAIQKSQESGGAKTPEQIMMDEGTLSREQIIHAIATLVRGCIQRFLTKPYGLFIFHPSDQLKGVKAITRISSLQIILDYSRAVKKDDIYKSLVPDTNMVPRVTVNIEEIRKRYHLTETEWKVLFQVDGEKTIEEIVGEIGVEPAEGLKLFYTMLMSCFIELDQSTTTTAQMGAATDPSASVSGPGSAPAGLGGGSASSQVAPPPPDTGRIQPPPSVAAAQQNGGNEAEQPAEEKKPSEGTILVVDDSRTIQKMVEMALKELPYDLIMADDGFQGLELAQQHDPDLVILDVIMPKLDGYKTCAQMKKNFAPRKVPVIMLTARDGTFDKIKGRLAGASMYMAKPFEPPELQEAVTKFMNESLSQKV